MTVESGVKFHHRRVLDVEWQMPQVGDHLYSMNIFEFIVIFFSVFSANGQHKRDNAVERNAFTYDQKAAFKSPSTLQVKEWQNGVQCPAKHWIISIAVTFVFLSWLKWGAQSTHCTETSAKSQFHLRLMSRDNKSGRAVTEPNIASWKWWNDFGTVLPLALSDFIFHLNLGFF